MRYNPDVGRTLKRTRKQSSFPYQFSLLTNYDYSSTSVPASPNCTKPARPTVISPSMPSIPASHILAALAHYFHSHNYPPWHCSPTHSCGNSTQWWNRTTLQGEHTSTSSGYSQRWPTTPKFNSQYIAYHGLSPMLPQTVAGIAQHTELSHWH